MDTTPQETHALPTDEPTDADPQAGSPHDRGQRLARLLTKRLALLILDGLEPLQYGPGPLKGQLKDPALRALLMGLAQLPFAGLCVLTSREPVVDLAPFHGKTVAERELEHLSEEHGAELLHECGAKHAGADSTESGDKELLDASREVLGHALTLRLLGRYLALAHGGDVRRRDRVRFEKADAETQGGHAFRVIAAHERWLRGRRGVLAWVRRAFSADARQRHRVAARHLAILRLLGLFDRPADPGCLAALRRPPVISGLTEPLAELDEEDWNITLGRLAELGLIAAGWLGQSAAVPQSLGPGASLRSAASHPSSSLPIHAHPLLREYFAGQLRERNPETWQAAHRRLYEHLCETTEHRPDTLDGLQPLYQAVAHGCQAGLQERACADVYWDRILRGGGSDGFYSTKKLGAVGANLGAVACFFEQRWSRLLPNLPPAARPGLLGEAAFYLRALGRLSEAAEPMRVTLELVSRQEDWRRAPQAASNLSELELTLGEVAAAVTDGRQSVTLADRSKDPFLRMGSLTTYADSLHQAGRRGDQDRRARQLAPRHRPGPPHAGAGGAVRRAAEGGAGLRPAQQPTYRHLGREQAPHCRRRRPPRRGHDAPHPRRSSHPGVAAVCRG